VLLGWYLEEVAHVGHVLEIQGNVDGVAAKAEVDISQQVFHSLVFDFDDPTVLDLFFIGCRNL
jgi:hypothetical protein